MKQENNKKETIGNAIKLGDRVMDNDGRDLRFIQSVGFTKAQCTYQGKIIEVNLPLVPYNE